MHNLNSLYGGYGNYGMAGFAEAAIWGEFLGIVQMFLGPVLFVMAIIGLALCFFGYKIQKFYVSLMSGIFAGTLGYGLMAALSESNGAALLVGLLLAIGGFYVGFKFFKMLNIIIAGLIGFSIAWPISLVLSSGEEIFAIIIGVIVGVGCGWLMAKIYKPWVIITTAILGGTWAGIGIYNMLFGLGQGNGSGVLAIILIAVGIWFQFKTADRSVSSAFGGSAEEPGLLDGIDNPQIANAKAKTMGLLGTNLNLPTDYPNAKFFFLGGGALALITLIAGRLSGIYMLEFLFIAAGLGLIFLMYNNTKLPETLVNSVLGVAVVFCAFAMLRGLSIRGGLNAVLLHGGLGLGVFMIWMTVIQKKMPQVLYTVAAGMLALCFLLIAFDGQFSFMPLGGICVLIPFVVPQIKNMSANNGGNNEPNQYAEKATELAVQSEPQPATESVVQPEEEKMAEPEQESAVEPEPENEPETPVEPDVEPPAQDGETPENPTTEG